MAYYALRTNTNKLVRTDFYSGADFVEKTKISESSYEKKVFGRRVFGSYECFFVRPNIISVRTNKILLVRTVFVDPNILKFAKNLREYSRL